MDRLIDVHKKEEDIKYHVACKANSEGYMDEGGLLALRVIKTVMDQ